jgi:hypothetical protein
MKTFELLENNPKAYQVIHDYYMNELMSTLDLSEFPEEFDKYVREQGLEMDKVVAIIEANPRNLFDVFDDNKIYIDIKADFDGTFRYALLEGTVSELGSLEKFKTRKEADAAAVEAAIVSLENKLKLLEKDNKDS